MKFIQFLLFYLVGLFLSILTNYLFIKEGKFGDYTQIIITGLYSFIPFVSLTDVDFKGKFCLISFFIVSISFFIPMFLVGVNQIEKTSILIYCLFLSIIFCRNKKRYRRII